MENPTFISLVKPENEKLREELWELDNRFFTLTQEEIERYNDLCNILNCKTVY